MAARTCLLCGKPLSRIWAGTGEDFCSREHRNQYRLRKGMGRLMEANAVANVMRRRENPKQIPTGDLRAPGPASPRGFLEAARRPPAEISIRAPKLAGKPRILPATRVQPPRAASASDAEARAIGETAQFPRSAPRGPKMSTRMPAHVAPAPPVNAGPRMKSRPQPHAPGVSWRGPGKPKVDALFARSGRRAASTMPVERPARRMAAARVGRALRVSTATGFRLPERTFPSSRFAGPELGSLPSPEAKSIVAAEPPETGAANVLEIEIPAREMRIPPAPEANFERRFRWPGTMKTKIPVCNAANEARPLAVPFGRPDEVKER